MSLRVAIVEDNASARTALRGHLLSIANVSVSSFTSGFELKGALKNQNFAILLIDFHLGEGKSGVEWIMSLKETGYLRQSTGIVFLTSDRSPETIGKIMDLQPDVLLIKPYTISSLSRQIKQYLNFRHYAKHILTALDKENYQQAIAMLQENIKQGVPSRLASDLRRLYAKLLYENDQLHEALYIYEQVLSQSDKVLWAQWGKIKCKYASGQWQQCKDELRQMTTSNLVRDRAFEWLASLSFQQKAYDEVEKYLDNIKFSELSSPALKLKSAAFQKCDKIIDAIELIQRKRAIHRSAKDKFNDYTFELATFYLLLAEASPETNRAESLIQARKFIGVAGRAQNDPLVLQKRDLLLALSAILNNESDKASHLLEADHMDDFLRTDSSTLVVAAKVYHNLGDDNKANTLLSMAKEKNRGYQSISEQVTNGELIYSSAIQLGLQEEQAVTINETGMQLFQQGYMRQAIQYFYDAYQLAPNTAAFGLNLLQSMVESNTAVFRDLTQHQLFSTIDNGGLSEANNTRLASLANALND